MCSEESEVELRHTSIDLFLWCSIKRSVIKIFSVLVLFLKSHVIHKTEKILTTNLLILKSISKSSKVYLFFSCSTLWSTNVCELENYVRFLIVTLFASLFFLQLWFTQIIFASTLQTQKVEEVFFYETACQV